ncbi:MAG: hypothetical protein ACKO96_00885, partial [Flammeovirgaceae bacterium]
GFLPKTDGLTPPRAAGDFLRKFPGTKEMAVIMPDENKELSKIKAVAISARAKNANLKIVFFILIFFSG